MAYTVKLSEKAQRQIDALPEHIRKRVARGMSLLSENPFRSRTCQLVGYPELRRIHASKDYVIVYSVLVREVVVLVIRVAHRREVYHRL